MSLAKLRLPLRLLAVSALLVSNVWFTVVQTDYVGAVQCPDGSTLPDADAANCPTQTPSEGAYTPQHKFQKNDCNEDNISSKNCGIIRYILIFINVLSALVGVVVVASIIIGGIQYSAAGSDPQKVSAAKDRIRNAILALIFFIFGYAFLNYLIPGGVL